MREQKQSYTVQVKDFNKLFNYFLKNDKEFCDFINNLDNALEIPVGKILDMWFEKRFS